MLTCPNCSFGNPEGARFCSNCGTALEAARPIEGERRFATVLFADVARSTAIAEQLDPEDWAQIMNGAFGFMNAAVSQYGGTVSRLMGDAVLALFGAPVAHEDDAERAVRAGLEIQAAAKPYAQAVKQRYGVDFDLRVGINTGTAVLAVVGDAIKSEYTALGDAANVAARLQSAAEPGTVLVSADTYRLVSALFDATPRGAIEMKGKLAPVESFEVTGAKVAPGPTRGLAGLESPLVGRDDELALLRQALGGLGAGAGAVVAVVGEAGLGKSRLVAELRHLRDAMGAAAPAWLESRAISYGQSIPYYPWRQLGRQIIGAADAEAAPAVREKLAAFVERLGLRQADLPFYETMLAVDTEDSRAALSRLGGEAIVNGVAGAVVNAMKAALRANGSARPQVLVMDDLHWSDTATLELIAQVATLAAFEPLLIVCVLRPDRRAPSWQLLDRLQASLGSSFARVDLEPLDASASGELLGNLLQIEDLPEGIRAQILERSEGNPFYLEEVLRSLIDGGQVVREGERWRATRDIIDARIPDTLAGVLSARIDRLPDATKRVAQTASVIGRVFQHRVLETLCREAPAAERVDHVEPHLATLSYEQVVREKSRAPEREYIFKHALTCEAAYDLMLRARRRELHARCGAALESLFADRRDEFAALLAHHFDEAGDARHAVQYSLLAADNARRLYALREELEHRERVLHLLDDMPEADPAARIDAVIDWTMVRHRLNRYEGVIDRLERATDLARASGDERRLAATLSWTGNIHMVTGFPSSSIPYLLESQTLAQKLGDEQLLLLPLFIASWSLVDRQPAEAVDALNEIIELAGRQQVLDVLGHATAYLAIALARLGRTDEARAQIEKALEIAPQAGSPVKEADIHIAVGNAYYDMGEIEKGLEHSRIGAEGAFRANGLECACAGYFGVGRGQLEAHHLDDAISEFDRSLDIAQQIYEGHAGVFGTLIRANRAVAEFEQGNVDAIDKLKTSLQEARSGNDEFAAATIAQELAEALIKRGRCDEAGPVLEGAIAYYRERGIRPYLAGALDLAAQVHEANGRADAAGQARVEAATLRSQVAEGHTGEVAAGG